MTCVKCRNQIDDDSVYCKWCGKKQTVTAAPKPLKRANGMGNVYKMKDRRKKPWRARMTLTDGDGNKKTVVIGDFELKQQALSALEKIYNSGGLPPLLGITVSEARELWKEKHYPQLSNNGVQTYEAAWNYFEPIKDMKLAEVKTAHIQSIIDIAIKKGRSKSTCEKIKHLASQLCKWGMQNDIVSKNYAAFTEINAPEAKEKEPFSSEELKQIWNYYQNTKDVNAAAILLLCHTGLRINELLAMKKTDFYDGCLHGGSKTEKGKDRTVPVPDVMLSVLQTMLEQNGEYIISNSNGKKYQDHNWRKRNYYKALRACGFSDELIKRRPPHCCRHTYSTMCVQAGVEPKALQDILGHEDISTTMNIYTHTDVEYLKEQAKKLNFITN